MRVEFLPLLLLFSTISHPLMQFESESRVDESIVDELKTSRDTQLKRLEIEVAATELNVQRAHECLVLIVLVMSLS